MSSDDKTEFWGLYSDGRTATAKAVLVNLTKPGLEIRTRENTFLVNWTYGSLTSSNSLHEGGAAQIGSKASPGARLYVEDGAFAHAIAKRAKQLSRWAYWWRLAPMFILGIAAIGLALVLWLTDVSVAKSIAQFLPDNIRHSLGDQVVNQLAGGKRACDAETGSEALVKVLGRLNSGIPSKRHFDVRVVDLGIVNAFAAPGERIVVSKDLVEFVETPEELAGIIAHEMGHGLEIHPEAGLVRALGISTVVSMIFGGTSSTLGDVGALLLQLKYTRTAEREADAWSLKILKEAQIPAKPFAQFFARMESKSSGRKKTTKKNEPDPNTDEKDKTAETAPEKGTTAARRETNALRKLLTLLSTHPTSPERIKKIEGQPEWPVQPLLTPDEWQALKRICKK